MLWLTCCPICWPICCPTFCPWFPIFIFPILIPLKVALICLTRLSSAGCVICTLLNLTFKLSSCPSRFFTCSGSIFAWILKSFKDLNYTITKATMMPSSGDDASYNDATCIRYATRTKSSFQIYNRGATDGGSFVNWHACGYIS